MGDLGGRGGLAIGDFGGAAIDGVDDEVAPTPPLQKRCSLSADILPSELVLHKGQADGKDIAWAFNQIVRTKSRRRLAKS